MPIRLNLLAEAQAAEEMRRRDPVKRALLIGGLLVVVMLVWGLSLWGKTMAEKSAVNRLESALNSKSGEFEKVRRNRAEWLDTKQKLEALNQLATNRFLYGNVLNALQQATVENVQMLRFVARQEYIFTPESRANTNAPGGSPGKPASVTEKITLMFEAKDSSRIPGDAIPSVRQTIGNQPYFQSILGRTNEVKLKDYGATQVGPDQKTYVQFTLECRFPDKTR